MKRIKAVLKKELFHIWRDPKSLLIVFLMPLIMMFIYGYAISYDLNNINIAIVDNSRSDLSKKFIKAAGLKIVQFRLEFLIISSCLS